MGTPLYLYELHARPWLDIRAQVAQMVIQQEIHGDIINSAQHGSPHSPTLRFSKQNYQHRYLTTSVQWGPTQPAARPTSLSLQLMLYTKLYPNSISRPRLYTPMTLSALIGRLPQRCTPP